MTTRSVSFERPTPLPGRVLVRSIRAGCEFRWRGSNHVQGESGIDDGVAAVLAGNQPAPGARNASFVRTALAGGTVVAAASVLGASASSSRDTAATFFAANTALAAIVGSF